MLMLPFLDYLFKGCMPAMNLRYDALTGSRHNIGDLYSVREQDEEHEMEPLYAKDSQVQVPQL
jgi:hypothetical protein